MEELDRCRLFRFDFGTPTLPSQLASHMALMAELEPVSNWRMELVGLHSEEAHGDSAEGKSKSELVPRTANLVKLLEKLKGGALQSRNELFNSLLMA